MHKQFKETPSKWVCCVEIETVELLTDTMQSTGIPLLLDCCYLLGCSGGVTLCCQFQYPLLLWSSLLYNQVLIVSVEIRQALGSVDTLLVVGNPVGEILGQFSDLVLAALLHVLACHNTGVVSCQFLVAFEYRGGVATAVRMPTSEQEVFCVGAITADFPCELGSNVFCVSRYPFFTIGRFIGCSVGFRVKFLCRV